MTGRDKEKSVWQALRSELLRGCVWCVCWCALVLKATGVSAFQAIT